jgi:hypothetical protein
MHNHGFNVTFTRPIPLNQPHIQALPSVAHVFPISNNSFRVITPSDPETFNQTLNGLHHRSHSLLHSFTHLPTGQTTIFTHSRRPLRRPYTPNNRPRNPHEESLTLLGVPPHVHVQHVAAELRAAKIPFIPDSLSFTTTTIASRPNLSITFKAPNGTLDSLPTHTLQLGRTIANIHRTTPMHHHSETPPAPEPLAAPQPGQLQ